MTAAPDTKVPERMSWRALPPLALVPIAALAWWLVGYLPWIVNDADRDGLGRLGVSTVALPLYAGNISVLVLGAGVGGVAAGLTARLGAGNRALRGAACTAGVGIALLATLIQSRSGIDGRIDDPRATNVLTITVVIVTLVGLAVGLLSLVGRVGLGFSLAAVAGAAPLWLVSVFLGFHQSSGEAMQNADQVSRWVGAAVLAAALIVVGLRPPVRLVAWVGIVILAWIIAPTMTAVAYAQLFLRSGMNNSPELWRDNLSATMDVWQQAVSWDMRPLTPWITAVVVAAAVSLWLASRGEATAPEVNPADSP